MDDTCDPTTSATLPPVPTAELLRAHAAQRPGHPALVSPAGHTLTYAALVDQIESIGRALRSHGVGRRDAVAVALPDGPQMAAVFLGVSQAAICAPLNPAYHEADFGFYLDDLAPHIVLLPQGTDSPLRGAATARGIPVLEVEVTEPGADRVARVPSGDSADPAGFDTAATNDDVALVLHTSGTTSRPKMVPLTHANLSASAHNVAATLGLVPEDRGLNLMPLFHIHGLVGGLLSSLAAGATVIAAPGFDGARVLAWAADCDATWYSAVPTIHQAVLDAARRDPQAARAVRFRLIRSSSASLPPTVLGAMEAEWGVPVVESYGMSEAAHQMTSNPLPPGERKPGSVGPAAGPDVAVMDAGGRMLPVGDRGEVVIRGANVMSGYANNSTANAEAFCDGWFRTGDEGYFDADGYLFLTGRLKEMVNRGGEKIAPREIDEALLAHPAVAQAVAFAVPHDTLGEDLYAAVVLEADASAPDHEVDPQSLRHFVAERLSAFKVPSRIVAVDAIPKGPTGKLQRIGLHERLADRLGVVYAAPETDDERLVAAAFEKILGVERVGRDDNFFALGGDSVRGIAVVAEFADAVAVELSAALLFENPTPATLGTAIARLREQDAKLDDLVDALEDLPPDVLDRILSPDS